MTALDEEAVESPADGSVWAGVAAAVVFDLLLAGLIAAGVYLVKRGG